MKQLKLLLILLALAMIFLFAIEEVQSSELSAKANALKHKKSRRLESEEGIKGFLFNNKMIFNFLIQYRNVLLYLGFIK